MGNSQFEDEFEFDKETAVRGTLETMLDILHENDVEENTLVSITLPSILWFDVLQACAVSGGMLLEASKSYEEDTDENNGCLLGVEKCQTIYNEVWDALVRLSKQKIK
jgi:hypothetical protein